MGSKKIVIVGLDGGAWHILEAMINAGFMPNLEKLRRESSYGTLKSTVVPITPVAWSSFHTGVNPGKHGIGGFLIPSTLNDQQKARKFIYANSKAIRINTGWGYLSNLEKRVKVVNVPMTYPPYKVNGEMVSCFMTPSLDSSFTYPAALQQEIVERGFNPIISPAASKFAGSKTVEAYIRNLDGLTLSVKMKTKQAHWFLKRHPSDLYMFHFQETDPVQHFAYKYIDASSPEYDEIMFKKIGQNFYSAVDESLGAIMGYIQNDDLLLIISDHGFKGYRKVFNINNWLYEQGMIKLNKTGASIKKGISFMRKLDIFGLRRFVRNQAYLSRIKDIAACNMDTTRIVALGNGTNPSVGLYCPNAGEDAIVKEIFKLIDVVDPQNKKKIIKRVIPRKDLYHGDFLDTMPNVVVEANDDYAISDIFKPRGPVLQALSENGKRSGIHDDFGIFLAFGQNIRKGTDVTAKIIDVFPTVINSLGLPVPDYMDGRVLNEIFSRPPETITFNLKEKDNRIEGNSPDDTSLTDEENRQLEKHLADLGYM